jgi:hypothetical protein
MITPTDLFSLLFATAEELSFFSPSPHEQMRGGLAFSLSPSLSPSLSGYLPRTKFLHEDKSVEVTVTMIQLDLQLVALYSSNSFKSKKLMIQLSRYYLPEKASLLKALIKGSLFYPFFTSNDLTPSLPLLPNDLLVTIASYLSICSHSTPTCVLPPQ